MRLHFTIRDLLWLAVVVALVRGDSHFSAQRTGGFALIILNVGLAGRPLELEVASRPPTVQRRMSLSNCKSI